MGCRDRRLPLRACCCDPCGALRPIGWIGGRYTTSKPIAATAGSRRRVPASPPSERGNSSYQAPNARALAIDPHGHRRRRCHVDRIGHRLEALDDVACAGCGDPFGRRTRRVAECGDNFVDAPPVAGWQPAGGVLEQPRALFELDHDSLARLVLHRHVVPPRGDAVRPCLDDEGVQADCLRHDRRGPQVVALVGHRLVPPLALAVEPPADPRAEDVVAVAEDGRRHRRFLPNDRFGGGARWGAGPDVVDNDATDHTQTLAQQPRFINLNLGSRVPIHESAAQLHGAAAPA